MIHYIIYLALHYIICLCIFLVIQRPIFFTIHRKTTDIHVNHKDLLAATRAGIRTDLAGAAYLTGLPLLTLWVCSYIGFDPVMPLMIADGIVALAMSLLIISDTVLYGYWRFRIDASVFVYLQSLRGVFASVSPLFIIGVLSAVLVVAAALLGVLYAAYTLSGLHTGYTVITGFWQAAGITLGFILGAGVDFAMIRGLRHRPNSPYDVYYSPNLFLNHTGINPMFNLMYSLSLKNKETDKFKRFDETECAQAVKETLPTSGKPTEHLLKTDRPNILVIVWESLCAHFVGPLGGKPEVTPNLNRLIDEGILFTHVDAGSWRTAPALVCIFSGYPAQPTTSIMRDTHKLPGLPALPRKLRGLGYTTSAIHGGPLSIMHKIDYYMASGHDRCIGIENIQYAPDTPKCRWGLHDDFMFDWLYNDLVNRPETDQPWFTTFQTLSSHQPYVVPFKKLDDPIDNSYAYTDEALGKFIDRFKKTPQWDNTLIIVVGDHGINMDQLPLDRSTQPHIPLVMLGGAIKEPKRIDTLMAQTDIAATLLGQMDIAHDDFTFSRDVLADTYTYPYTMHIYNNGFLYRDATGYTDYDNVAGAAVAGSDAEREKRGLMFMQYMMADLSSNRKKITC